MPQSRQLRDDEVGQPIRNTSSTSSTRTLERQVTPTKGKPAAPTAPATPDLPEAPEVLSVKGQGEGAVTAMQTANEWGAIANRPDNPFVFRRFDKIEDFEALRTEASTSTGGARDTSGVVDFAKKFIGTPYVWGGSSPLGFDCSGFTQYVMKQVYGIDIPRVSAAQGQAGRGVDPTDLKPGDLIFWDNSSRNNGADHVAIYIGNGQYIDAPRPGKTIGIRTLSNNGWWARRYA